MNENQLQELYNKISAADSTYSKRYTFDQFKANMQDQAYVDKLSSWASSRGIDIQTEQPPVQQQPTQQQPVANAYNAADLLKKKSFQSVSSSDQSSSASTTEGDGLNAMNAALSFKPQPLPSEGTRAGVPPIQQQQKVQQQIQQREDKRTEKMAKGPDFFKEQVKGINSDLMSKEEEYVVPQLNYKFGPMGFKFEESGIGNNVTVTAPNGTKKEISLVNATFDVMADPLLKKMTSAKQANELQKFILDNSVDTKDLAQFESKYKGEKKKFETDNQMKEALSSASKEYDDIARKIKDYAAMSDDADKELSELNSIPQNQRNTAEYKQRYALAIEKKQEALRNAPNLEDDRARAEVKYNELQKAAGDYFLMKGEQGTWTGAFMKGVYRNTGSAIAGLTDLATYLSAPMVALRTIANKETNEKLAKSRESQRDAITNFFIDNFGDKSTTEQWEAVRNETTMGKAVLGLGAVVPAMVATAATGGLGGAAVFASQGYNDTMIEAREAGIPEGERELVAIPVGITMGVIGELGLKNIPGVNKFAASVTKKALGDMAGNFTATEFKNYVTNEIKSSVARGVVTMGKGFLHGFETGVKMDVATNLIKDTYNVIKDKKDEDDNYMKVFNTPNSIAEYFTSAVESGLVMGIGGGILSSREALGNAMAKNNYNGVTDKKLELFSVLANVPESMSLVANDIKNKIIQGKMTKEQGELELSIYQKSVSLFKSLPDDLTNAQKRKALGLLQEKEMLSRQIDGKDQSLTKKQRDRITEIDGFLSKISEGKYTEVSELKPEDVKVTAGDKVMWNPESMKENEEWTVSEVKDDSVTLTKGEETQTLPLEELQQHLIDENAVQKPTTDESVLRAEQPEMGLQKVAEGDTEAITPEAKTEEKEVAKTALEQASEARRKAKEALNSISQGLGIDPTARTRALVDYHKALITEAKEFIKEKAEDFTEWVKTMGGEANIALQKAWDEATGKSKPIENAEELGYDMQDLFGEDLPKLPEYETTMKRIQDFADYSTRNKEYWESQLNQAKKSGNKEKERESRDELKKYTEGNLEAAMDILEKSDTYKLASDVQRESLVRDLRERFEMKEKKAPKPEELFGDVADVNKVMEEIEFQFEDAEKSKSYLEDKYEKAKAQYEESVKNGTPSDTLKRNMDKAKAEVEEYKTKNIEDAKKALRATEMYKKADKEQQQKMEKYLEDRFLKRKGVLPTKLFEGAKEGGKVTISEKRRWADQLKAFVRGIKNQAEASKEMMKEVRASLEGLAKGGKITAKQATTLIDRMSKIKVFNEESVSKFIDYASKLFADAEYGKKLNEAKDLRKNISRLSRNKETNLDLKEVGERFSEIDPSMVDKIELYNENASKIAEAMKASLGKKLGETVVIEKMSDYIKETMDAQIERMTEIKQKQLEELGIDATDMSYAEIVELIKALKEDKPLTDEQEKAARDMAKKQFEMNAAIVNEMIESGKDPFTGDDINFTETQKKLVKEFMDMNLSYFSVREANAAAAALDNFITNGSIAKMSVITERYKGLVETKDAYDKGIRAKSLKSIMLLGLFPKTLGRIWAEKIGTVTNVIDRLFRSPGIASEISKAIGLTDVINGHSKGVRIAQDRIKEFADKFNKGDFNTAENQVETGMYADLLRSVDGTPEQIQAEFNAKKESIKEDIKKLKESKDDDLIKEGELYQKVYDKIIKDSNNADEVKRKMNPRNVEAVDWWVNEFGKHYNQLSEVTESVYNRRLDKEKSYTPRTIKYIKSKPREIGESGSLFMGNRGMIYTGETGVIMEATKNKPPKDMYVDYSFSKNMSEALYDAMIDINTAAKTARLKSAVDSPFFQAMFEGNKDYDVVRNVISSYVRDMRGKTIYDQSELASGIRAMNSMATLGVNMSLAGVTQPVKQIVPILGNTMVNAGVINTMNAIGALSRGGLDFVNRSGRDVAVRGQESSVNISDLNSMIKTASESLGGKAIDAIENANKAALKYTLKMPDVWVAKTSWLAYYEKYLRDNNLYANESMKLTERESSLIDNINKEADDILSDSNSNQIDIDWANRWKKNALKEQRENVEFWENEYKEDPSESNKNILSESKELYNAILKSKNIQTGKLKIDYTTHELNEKAADYADSQIRRQQNVSLRELQGGMFKSQNTIEKLVVQTLMPFSNFRMNQKSRMGNDMFTIFSDVATKQEKLDATKSLAGTGVEAMMFNAIRIAIGYGLWQAANALIGNEPTEEQEEKYMNTMIKGSATGVINDFFSPLPPFDPATSYGANALFDMSQDLADIEDEDKLNVFDGMSKQDITKAFGLLGVVPSRVGQTAEAINLWSTGNFKDDFGRIKTINDESRDAMGQMSLISLLSLSGLGLAETNTVVKDAIKIIKKGAKVESKLTSEELKEKEKNKKERAESKQDKINSINVLIEHQNDPDVVRELLKIRKELEKGRDKKERREDKKKMEELLQGYDSKSDMKRYDPDLYERTFGEGTKYYMENRGEIEAEKKLREYMREQEDIEQNYRPKGRKQTLRFENKRTLRFRRKGP